MSSIVPVDHLQIVCNGKVAQELNLNAERTAAHVDGSIPLETSGWCVLRAFSDKAEYPILDIYPYATTSPIYVDVAGAPLQSPADASYFVAWIDRQIAAARGTIVEYRVGETIGAHDVGAGAKNIRRTDEVSSNYSDNSKILVCLRNNMNFSKKKSNPDTLGLSLTILQHPKSSVIIIQT